MKYLFVILLCCISQLVASAQAAPNYAERKNWYKGEFTTNKRVDVLFFAPTSVDGDRNMNTGDAAQRAAIDYWAAVANELFGESCDVYVPYYRQVGMGSWGTPSFAGRYATALSDAQAAFDYYMKYCNNGRPFILAGHSQGALLVYSLIKSRINATNYPLLVAAYPIGYKISKSEVESCPYIIPARGATDTGVCVSYHSAATAAASMFPTSYININPMNWSTDTLTAPASANLGSVFFDSNGRIVREFKGVITARLDADRKCVVVSGLKPKDLYKPYLGRHHFALGNYHLSDLSIFFRNVQQNVEDRIRSYFYATSTKLTL